jgi:hypothetical protein
MNRDEMRAEKIDDQLVCKINLKKMFFLNWKNFKAIEIIKRFNEAVVWIIEKFNGLWAKWIMLVEKMY